MELSDQHWLIYPGRNSSWYPLNRRFRGTQSWPVHFQEGRKKTALSWIEPQFLGTTACILVIIPTMLSQLDIYYTSENYAQKWITEFSATKSP